MAGKNAVGLAVRQAKFQGRERKAIISIRQAVFTREQGVDPGIDLDGRDPSAVHVLVRDQNEAVGTGRMLPDGHLGRIAVRSSHRGRGAGQMIVAALVDHARAEGLHRVWLGSQLHARRFYEMLGFSPFGDEYEEAGIRHIHMEMILNE